MRLVCLAIKILAKVPKGGLKDLPVLVQSGKFGHPPQGALQMPKQPAFSVLRDAMKKKRTTSMVRSPTVRPLTIPTATPWPQPQASASSGKDIPLRR